MNFVHKYFHEFFSRSLKFNVLVSLFLRDPVEKNENNARWNKIEQNFKSFDNIFSVVATYLQKRNNVSLPLVLSRVNCIVQKQPSRGVLRRWCSENMQQIYRRTPMPKSDLNKVTLQLYWKHTSTWMFSCKFPAYFQNTFSQVHLLKTAF